MTTAADSVLGARDAAALFEEHGRFLWGLLYRLTGCAADADDLLQETFVRAIERAPSDRTRPLRPWLVHVAMNLGRDLLRRRRRTPYVGPWLPSPVAGDDERVVEAVEAVAAPGASTEGRYDMLESMSLAFLVALEALTPQQRAVLLLRDVFDYKVEETAIALGCGAAAVKATHLRARRAMQRYDAGRIDLTAQARTHAQTALWNFAEAVATGDTSRVESMLAADAVALSDGGGEFYAARKPVYGASNVARFLVGIFAKFQGMGEVVPIEIGGMPALLVTLAPEGQARLAELPEHMRERLARRFVLQLDVDRQGRIARTFSVLASRKLTAVAGG